MLFHWSDLNSENPSGFCGFEISDQVSVLVGTGSSDDVSVVGARDGGSQPVIWTVATSTGSVMEAGLRSGLALRKEESLDIRL